MRIAFDCDGVLTDLENYQLKYGREYFKNIPENKIDKTEIDIEGIFNCTHAEREKFWTKYIWRYCLKEPPRKNIAATIKKLKDEGNEILIITGRAHTTEDGVTGELFRKMLLHWLKKENIVYDKIVFCSEGNSAEDKYKACLDNKVDIIIDDKKENIDALKDIIKVICFDAEYNRMYNHPSVPRVYNSNQIYDEIKKFQNADYFEKLPLEKLTQMTDEEKEEYFKKMKEYYYGLPYDERLYSKTEKNYRLLSKTALPIYNLMYPPTVFNRELLPNEDGLLFVANHNNYYDQFPIISAIGDHRPIHFLTATKMLKMKRGAIYLKTGAVSIDRENEEDRHFAKDEIIKILSHDGNVFIFPEGKTNRTGEFLQEFHPGAASIAQACGCKIVPIAVSPIYNKKTKEPVVRFGEPFKISASEDVLEATSKIKSIIGNLKQENIDYLEKTKVKKR